MHVRAGSAAPLPGDVAAQARDVCVTPPAHASGRIGPIPWVRPYALTEPPIGAEVPQPREHVMLCPIAEDRPPVDRPLDPRRFPLGEVAEPATPRVRGAGVRRVRAET